ncbi:hypothetical protein G5714_005662 [Onychostoma macrolepis]|uniref:C-type lectin domain-containing protein n=1 Tax=Onychostoma macrolepis TaxID=369639 RepID=A0A7J6D1M5_9TELE|nr:hypothetical protein G5714_005662 [Onychostoma macrolepis]
MNEYEESETTQMRGASQTEDVYQCLQYRPPAAQGAINSTTLLSKMWLLHDNVFYLFWSDHSDCSAAESFCSKRNASLAILTEHNKVWLMSRTNGKHFLVSRAASDGSGDTASPSVDDEDCDCGILTADTDHGEGFVCERRVNPIGTAF